MSDFEDIKSPVIDIFGVDPFQEMLESAERILSMRRSSEAMDRKLNQEMRSRLRIETARDDWFKTWRAWQEGSLDGVPNTAIVGTGSSEEDAITDLLEKLDVKV